MPAAVTLRLVHGNGLATRALAESEALDLAAFETRPVPGGAGVAGEGIGREQLARHVDVVGRGSIVAQRLAEIAAAILRDLEHAAGLERRAARSRGRPLRTRRMRCTATGAVLGSVRRSALARRVLSALLAAAAPATAATAAARAPMAIVVAVSVSAGSARTTIVRAWPRRSGG
jgi:hypothetical protein